MGDLFQLPPKLTPEQMVVELNRRLRSIALALEAMTRPPREAVNHGGQRLTNVGRARADTDAITRQDLLDHAVARRALRLRESRSSEKNDRKPQASLSPVACDLSPSQAAPLTCSSIVISPRPTAFTNASTTRGSKRVPAKLLIFSTT